MCRDELNDKTLADRWLRYHPRYRVVLTDDGKTYAIKDTKTNQFVIEGGWSRKKDAEDFLAVSLMLGKLKD